MLTMIVRAGLLASAACLTVGQTIDKSLTFDAASVKPAAPLVPDGQGLIRLVGPSGGPGTKDPGRIRYPNMSLKLLLMNAYDVKNFQIQGPAWLDSERFDINATMPPETTKEQFRGMLQNLLTERFKMTVHRETKDFPMYSLVVAKSGLKMKELADVPPAKEDQDAPLLPGTPKVGADGFPLLPEVAGRPGIYNIMMPGRGRMIAQQQTMQDLANRLTRQLDRPVMDATGLKGKYDFILTFSTEGLMGPMGPLPPAPPPGASAGGPDNVFRPDGEAPPDIFAAVQTQLGLKLEAKKGPVEIIVVDRIEKTPIEN